MKTEFTMRNVAIKQTVKPYMNEESETARIGMNNINSKFSRGVDASQGGVTASVITTPAEKSALNANVERNPQKTEMQDNQGGDLRQSDFAEPGKHRATTGLAFIQKEGGIQGTEMLSKNIQSSQGIEALQSSVTAPAVNQANGGDFQPQARINEAFGALRGADAENIGLSLVPAGHGYVSSYMLINYRTSDITTASALIRNLQDLEDELVDSGLLMDGDQIETFSFVYDLADLKLLYLRLIHPDEEGGGVEIPRDHITFATIERFLADYRAESWRALWLRRKLKGKAA
jgi:hypothetical protein